MAFKAIIHGLDDKENYKNIIISIVKYRIEKSFKVLKANKIQSSTITCILNNKAINK